MLKQFYPRERRETTYEIPFEEFYKQGIRGVIFDVDNTLVPHDAPDVYKRQVKRTEKCGD